MEYNKEVLRRFMKPKFIGTIKNPDGIGKIGNPSCGDVLELFIKVGKNKKGEEIIKDIKFRTFGCVAAIASSEVVCELTKGKTIIEAKKITRADILRKVGELPPVKHHCSVLGEEALLEAIKNYENKSNKPLGKK
jgi:nitrogen fixation NifU-like protein